MMYHDLAENCNWREHNSNQFPMSFHYDNINTLGYILNGKNLQLQTFHT